MTRKHSSRGARTGAHHGSGIIGTLERADNTPPLISRQAAFLARRLGALDPATLATIATLVFGEVTK